ncbi:MULTISPECIES: helix-turn-helix domain-containing protein [Pseudoalteromonas]|uniref:helix-turn-helix domain-containing protein n=1 Tax=Pseudoalteromonas TaxID=53246 RepID=UPI00111391BE|nr:MULTISPECIES: helix-turn-helix domain-containing protein [Pseudoalteromonas]
MPLKQYIEQYFDGNQTAFARAQGVKLPQVTQWLNKQFIVIGHTLYSPRRDLNHD